MSTIYLIRHAQASFGQEDYDQLSALGYQQATVLADHLRALEIVFDSCYTGENKRHLQTLGAYQEILADVGKPLAVTSLPAFNEYDFETVLRSVIPYLLTQEPAFHESVAKMMQDNNSFQVVFERAVFTWLEKPEEFPKLLSWRDFTRRIESAVKDIIKKEGRGKNIALFTSGGVISAIVQMALNLSNINTIKISWQIQNASITRIKYHQKKVILSGFNDTGFLAVSPQKGLLTYR